MPIYLVRFQRSVELEEVADLEITEETAEAAKEAALLLIESGQATLEWNEHQVAAVKTGDEEIVSVEEVVDPDEIITEDG